MFKKRGYLKSIAGFTIAELMISALIMLPIFTGVILVFIRSLELNELTQNTTTALWAAKSRMSDIENTAFANIVANYNNVTFTTPGLDGIGVTYVTVNAPDLLEVTTTFCWREKNGRLIGEDTNLNGVLNGGEDQNGNGILDSKVQLRTLLYDS